MKKLYHYLLTFCIVIFLLIDTTLIKLLHNDGIKTGKDLSKINNWMQTVPLNDRLVVITPEVSQSLMFGYAVNPRKIMVICEKTLQCPKAKGLLEKFSPKWFICGEKAASEIRQIGLKLRSQSDLEILNLNLYNITDTNSAK